MKKKIFFILTFLYLYTALPVLAHEAYVLPQNEFKKGLQTYTSEPLLPLLDTTHLQMTMIITILVILSYVIALLWATTKPAAFFHMLIRKASFIGPLIIRFAIASSFFFSAQYNVIFGPELSLSALGGGWIVRILLYFLSLFILCGLATEIAAGIGIMLFVYASVAFGMYMVTYANYLGELLVLLFFGSRFFSFDYLFFGTKRLWLNSKNLMQFETPLVRILYGIALIYAGVSIKFLHQGISVLVYDQYNLKNFFHASASFIAAGAGLSEILIGLFILLGFVQRWTILISLFFITLSLLYFHEMLWPHIILYGISISLLINSSDILTIDRYMVPWVKKILKNFISYYN